jgi:1-acyl-sn-glycerol-3-phosphate acyltransferase
MVLMSGWIAADALDQDSPAGSPPPVSARQTRCNGAASNQGSASSDPSRDDAGCDVLERRSPLMVRLFTRHLERGLLRRSFHGVRLLRETFPASLPDGPLIVALNHASWWDPLVCLVLAKLFPGRKHFAPMEAEALQRYGIFRKLGLFGIDSHSAGGIRAFLRTSQEILSCPDAALWITVQGKFTDARERPAGVRPGVAHLASRLERGCILPLALEYPFWNEKNPEALAAFGPPISIEHAVGTSVARWRARVEAALEQTQDVLAKVSQKRDPSAFDSLVDGKVGIGGVYDAWRRLLALARRERFHPGHQSSAVSGIPQGRPC